MNTNTLHTALSGTAAPDWVQLVPAGSFTGRDGRGPYRLRDPQAVIAASMAEGKLAIDENHATDFASKTGIPSPARGWIVEMQARDDGLWGRVEWTDTGRQLMAEQAYRGISPVFVHDKAGTVLRVLRAALTNTPNLGDLATLNHREPSHMDLARMRHLLGLGPDADEAAILAAVERNATERATHAAQMTSMVKPEVVTALQAELDTARRQMATEKAAAFVDAAIAAGKPIAALRDHYVARHVADAASVEKEIGALVSINAGGLGGSLPTAKHDAADGDMTTEEMSICKRMGIKPDAYAKQFKKKAA